MMLLAIAFIGVSKNAEAQADPNDEIYDNTTVPAKRYEINGSHYTFDEDISEAQLNLLGKWKPSVENSDLGEIRFSDNETVIVVFNNVQFKGFWLLRGGRCIIELRHSDDTYPKNLVGSINDDNNLVLEGFGPFKKQSDK